MNARNFLGREERRQVEAAIGAAEHATSGEIRVHLTNRCSDDPKADALKVFHTLGMTGTAARNGVLVFVACESRKVVILGDKGINDVVPEGFWRDIVDGLTDAFAAGKQADGLCWAVQNVGEKLKAFFPYRSDDVNELSDEISIEDDTPAV